MADRGRKLDDRTRQSIVRLQAYTPIKATARMLQVSKNTVKKYSGRNRLKFDPTSENDLDN